MLLLYERLLEAEVDNMESISSKLRTDIRPAKSRLEPRIWTPRTWKHLTCSGQHGYIRQEASICGCLMTGSRSVFISQAGMAKLQSRMARIQVLSAQEAQLYT
jgi:hypothetical protein